MAPTIAKTAVIMCRAGIFLLLLTMDQAVADPTGDKIAVGSPIDAGPHVGRDQRVADRPAPPAQDVIAYGPFRVRDAEHAALVDVTDTRSPAAFEAMLRDHPGIATIEMVNCPGTVDDRANLRLGHMIRTRRIMIHVPSDGYVGSGAIELFLAGIRRTVEPGAVFAVHSWQDESGREPSDYAPDAPQNRVYLKYYRDMGLSASQAMAFYAMTNSVPFSGVKWLSRADLAVWVDIAPRSTAPLARH